MTTVLAVRINAQTWPHALMICVVCVACSRSAYHNLLPQAAAAYRAYEPTDYALFIDRDLGGWNNIRMAFEVQVGLAYKYRRKFVLPIKRRFYLVENAVSVLSR